MRVAAPVLLLALAACSSPSGWSEGQPASGSSRSAAAQRWERDPFTRTSEIEIDGTLTGYLVEYQPIPAGVDVERALPTGSYRIQDRQFDDIGFISPRGEVRRYTSAGSLTPGSVSLGSWSLEEGLLKFFGGTRRAKLTLLEPRPFKPAPKPAPEGEPAPAGEGGETDAKPDDEGGG